MSDERTDDSASASEGSARQTFDVFISYASADKDVARLLANRLADLGLRVWFDEFQLRVGQNLEEEIRDALERSRACLILLSSQALPSKPWVSKEWSTIRECSWRRRDLSICSVKLDDVDTPPFLRAWQSLSLDKHAKDPSNFDQILKKIVLYVRYGDAANKTYPSESDQSATAERFAEIQQALAEIRQVLVEDQDEQNQDEDAGSDD